MKNIKKLLSVLLTVCMALSLLPMTALADEITQPNTYLVTNENNEIKHTDSTLADAVAYANSGWTISVVNSLNSTRIVNDANNPVTITDGKTLTLNLCEQMLNLSSDSGPALTVSKGSRLTVTSNGTLNLSSGSGPALTVSGDGSRLTLETDATSDPKVNVTGVQNGLSVTDGGSATVTSVSTGQEGGAAVSAEGTGSRATVTGDVTVSAYDENDTPSEDATFGVWAKSGGSVEVGGSVSLHINGVIFNGAANEADQNEAADCVAAYAYGYGTSADDSASSVHVAGNVSAESKCGGAYGAAADNGVYDAKNSAGTARPYANVDVEGDASATGVGTSGQNDMVAAAGASNGARVDVGGDAFANGTASVFGCVANNGGTTVLNGDCTVTAAGGAAYGAAADGNIGDRNVYTRAEICGDTTVTSASNTYGGFARDGGDILFDGDLSVTAKNAAALALYASGTYGGTGSDSRSCVTAQERVTYSGDEGCANIGALAMAGGNVRVNGYFTKEVGTPVIQVNSSTNPILTTPDAYDTYTDGSNDGSAVYIIGLGKISGTVADADGKPLEGVTVWVYQNRFSAVTDANGHYTIDPMPLHQAECWATAEISEDVSRTVNPFTLSMNRGSTTTVDFTNTSALFAETYDSSQSNDTATLGLKGTRASSSAEAVVSAFANESRIRLTSKGEGSATVTVTDASSHTATIVVTVDAHGYLTIGAITKYSASSGNTPTGGSTTTPPTTTVSGSTATTTVTPSVSGVVATGSVTAPQMSDALKKAQAAAGTGGTPNVTIQVSGASGASSVATTIPHASMQALVSGGVGALTVSGPTGSVSFDAAALKTISGASGNVTVTVTRTDSATLSASAKALVGSHPVFTLSVTSGGSAITQFGGDVTVAVPYTPASGEDINAVVIYYIAADGTPTLVPDARYDAATGTVVFTTTHFSTYAVGYNKVGFTDVADTVWYAAAVTFLSARGVTSGTTATTFSPGATLTRGQFITMLLRACGVAAVTNPTDNFTDAGSTYYTGYLAAAKKLGITSGVGGNKFAPDKAITRQEMFTLLYNALKALDKLPSGASGKTLSDFTDAGSISSYAQNAMAALVKAGIVTGSKGTLNPTGTTTRAEMAQVLYNLLGK